ncbi:putative cyclic nucleotide-gated ion channel 5 [Camellia lanceoleosa]|uniref:Cyclic nucleotide-gated ion channel 5 n=1 Tax=Camellia lanceoleosa TaxID=1840588 RepID=A0ACC0H7U1_9ERIC|nr:putative cyclic nucleotide-gated ion channel 5 [Camellia lanceoleosa]
MHKALLDDPEFRRYVELYAKTYLQSLTIRLEEMRIKRRDSEQWMHHRLLPQDLRERVRRYDRVVVQGPGPGPRYGHVMALDGGLNAALNQ